MKSVAKNSGSGIEHQPSALPRGWKLVPAGAIAEIKLGKMLDRAKHTSGTARPYLRNISVRWGSFDTDDLPKMFFDAAEVERYSVRQGDLVVCEGGEPGRAAIWRDQKPVMFQKALHRVRPGPAVTAEWLLICLRHYARSDGLKDFVSGSTIKHFTRDAFTRLPIPLPPLAEQRRIVARLEALEARSRRVREWLAEIPAQLAQARQSLLAAAFRGFSRRVPHDEAAAGQAHYPLPSRWRYSTLAELVAKGCFCSDGDWIESKDQDADGDVRLVQLADVGVGHFRDRSNRFMTSTKAEKLSCTYLKAGDILIARMPDPLGRACIFPGDSKSCVTVIDICVFRVQAHAANAHWVMNMLNSPQMRAQVLSAAAGTTRNRISRGNLIKLTFPLPPLAEQHEIVRRLETALARLDAAERAHAAAVAELDRLDQSLLARAFSGTLVPQDPADEPASALLARTSAPPPVRRIIPTPVYFVQLVPALLRAVDSPLSLERLNAIIALLFLPKQFLPLLQSTGGRAARAHFADFAQPNEPGALLAALKLLARAGTLTHSEIDGEVRLQLHSARIPPIDPTIETDARHLAAIASLVPPAVAKSSRSHLRPAQLRQALLTVP